jgi:hypothetical protein
MISGISDSTDDLLAAAERWSGCMLIDKPGIGANSPDMVCRVSTSRVSDAPCWRVKHWLHIAPVRWNHVSAVVHE